MLPESQKFEFGEFLLDAKEKRLLRNDKLVAITPKAFELLLVLVSNHGSLVEKNELISSVWAESFVEEANLPFTIGLLRKALGDNAQQPTFIETVPKRGYRFIADVRLRQSASPREIVIHNDNELSRPYVLGGLFIVIVLSFLVLSFVWFRGVDRTSAGQVSTAVTTDGKVSIAVIAPDERTLVFARKDENGEGLWRRNLDSGTEIELLSASPVEFVGLAITPDSRYAYYSVFSANAVASNFPGSH
jgi:DNA-binding winged helix-turn-helix (wHTH) protein